MELKFCFASGPGVLYMVCTFPAHPLHHFLRQPKLEGEVKSGVELDWEG